ncbi:MAG: low-specificity L-threonine aldolase [Candidatus Krumholzibacteriota bacterium]|nr:low-specificity L-threonine aldolase [Candidatus Krumholzibacteriota bacterium]
MSGRIVDLRSDTVTRPSADMRKAMSQAQVGDDVLGDDPTVISLEERMAALLGKESAVYVPSGTMANLLGLLSQTRPGDEVILDGNCHIFNYEAGGASVIGGLQLHPMNGPDGFLPLEELPRAVRPDNIHHPHTSLISVENTHNRGGGRIYPFEQLEEVYRFAKDKNLRVHMDGARLANAVVATGIPFKKYGALADSINICFSKGMGAPVGSVMISDRETVKRARYWRKRLGGGMRQSGILAQACHYALDNNIERLAEDHLLASRVGAAIEKKPGLTLSFPVETNIVIFRVGDESIDFEKFTKDLENAGIRVLAFGNRSVRIVTHLDVSPADIDYFESVMSGL